MAALEGFDPPTLISLLRSRYAEDSMACRWVSSWLRRQSTCSVSAVLRRTAVPRQQTLRATIDWSYELLSEPERRLLCRLAIFPAGFGLDIIKPVVLAPRDLIEDFAVEPVGGLAPLRWIAEVILQTKAYFSHDSPLVMDHWRHNGRRRKHSVRSEPRPHRRTAQYQ
jgi:hypothetical protein